MAILFNWIQITALSYLMEALLSAKISAIIPLWLCGAMVAICYMVNYFLISSKLEGLKIIVLNYLSCLVFSFIPIAIYEFLAAGRIWPSIFPGILVFFMVWFLITKSFEDPPIDKTKVTLWEAGIITSSFGMFLSFQFDLRIPYASLIPIVIIAAGLLSHGLKKREESSEVIRTSKTSNGDTLAAMFLIIAGTASLFGVLGLAFQRIVGDTWMVTLKGIGDWLKMLEHPVEKKSNPLLDVLKQFQQQASTTTVNDYGASSPLWLMIILWTILALTVLLTLILLILKLKDFIISLKSMTYVKPNNYNKVEITSISKLLKEFFRGLYQYTRKWIVIVKRVLSHLIGKRPKSINALFSYYLWWGRRIGIKKYNYETPQEYLKRLQTKLEAAYPELAASLSQLTLAHEKQCYGVGGAYLSEREIKVIFSILVKYKGIKRQISGDRGFIEQVVRYLCP